MEDNLCLTIRFLQPYFHGRGDSGEPEWPPSPFRLFQALCAAAAARWNERQRFDDAAPALEWLSAQPNPLIIASGGIRSETPYRLFVPDNVADKVAKSWSGGRDASIADYRTEKDVRPTHLLGEAVHYLYPLPPEGCPHLEVLQAAARSITHLGWGIDMVAADARVITQEQADKLPGHRWRVVASGGVPLRVPKPGTLKDLMRRHEAFLNRLSQDGFKPVPPLTCFDVVRYYSPTAAIGRPPIRPLAAFEIHRTLDDRELNPGKSRFRPFHHVRQVAAVAGMVRHAAAVAAEQMGMPRAWVDEHILGHGNEKNGQGTSDERLMFLPLPSLQPVVGVGSIRRVLIVGWSGFSEFSDLRRRLNGMELIDQETLQPKAVLSQLAMSDRQVQEYLRRSRTWTSVTPVILPGLDDPDGLRRKYRKRAMAGTATTDEQSHLLKRLHSRILSLLTKAFHHAGWTDDALRGVEIEYRHVGWLHGLDLAQNYQLPKALYPRYHVLVKFPREVNGPIVLGAGRYRGFGLFASTESSPANSGN